jgi:hypothetical protein
MSYIKCGNSIMCWNADVSINTFIFGILALIFIYLSSYTKYKEYTFNNPFVYIFLLEIIFMQLVEYFIWNNLNNKKNNFYSLLGSILVFIQPITLMFIISNKIKYILMFIYALYSIIYFTYRHLYNPIVFHSSVGKNGHLSWDWMKYKGYEYIFLFVYLLIYVVCLLYINYPILKYFTIIALGFSLFNLKHNTFASMWCWYTNIILLFFIINILLIQPFIEYNGIC